MGTETTERGTARQRLLAAADELFYAEGIHTVGIDRIIDKAGVAKASLYNTFGSKDELIRAYLQSRLAARQARMAAGLAKFDDPRSRLLAVFDVQQAVTADPKFRGCAFLNASAESPSDSAAAQVSQESRQWLRTTLVELARAAGVRDPDTLAAQFALLYDGASVSARLDGDHQAATKARAAAEKLLDAALWRGGC